MSEKKFEKSNRTFLTDDGLDMSALCWQVSVTDDYLDVSLDINGEDNRAIYLSGFASSHYEFKDIELFKKKVMVIQTQIDSMLSALQDAERVWDGKENS